MRASPRPTCFLIADVLVAPCRDGPLAGFAPRVLID